MTFGGRYIYKHKDDDDVEDDEYHEICDQSIDETLKTFFFKMGILVGSLVVALIWPTYQFFSHGIKSTAMQLKLPYIEERSNAEFIGNLLFQFIIVGHGFLGYIGLEVGIDASTDLIQITHKISEYRLRKMNNGYKEQSLNVLQLSSVFGNVVRQIRNHDKYCLFQDLNGTRFCRFDFRLNFCYRFVICLREMFYYRCFLTPPGYTYAIAMAIFCQFSVCSEVIRRKLSHFHVF